MVFSFMSLHLDYEMFQDLSLSAKRENLRFGPFIHKDYFPNFLLITCDSFGREKYANVHSLIESRC